MRPYKGNSTSLNMLKANIHPIILDLLLGLSSILSLSLSLCYCKFSSFSALQDMCPLRFILIFFSAVLAAYFAWTTVVSSPESDFTDQDHNKEYSSNKDHFNFTKMIQNGFWVFVDMASGRYLWRNLMSKNDVEVKSS
ncbi:uncharacterized protein LOC113861989 [Abrus precatorius]|uniref:Uncharacterized protein LOC113861989 n=1 Tax=Abrus precatorius TaxID=3816 RepID=A0A8B8L426_ABRPR|nr:uncharacterized protein LOC113861989 [Abrus precatorius]